MKNNIFKELRLNYLENGKPVSLRRLEELFDRKIAFSHISELESGSRIPSSAQLKVYHDFFNVSYEYLLGEDDIENYDMFKKHIEVVNTVDYIWKSTDELEIKIRELVRELLTTDRGYALLSYLSDFLYKDVYSSEDIANILAQIKSCSPTADFNSITIRVANRLGERPVM